MVCFTNRMVCWSQQGSFGLLRPFKKPEIGVIGTNSAREANSFGGIVRDTQRRVGHLICGTSLGSFGYTEHPRVQVPRYDTFLILRHGITHRWIVLLSNFIDGTINVGTTNRIPVSPTSFENYLWSITNAWVCLCGRIPKTWQVATTVSRIQLYYQVHCGHTLM
jgi:hypothetical protein